MAQPGGKPIQQWTCEKCTVVQSALNDECMVCRNPSPQKLEKQKQKEQQADDIKEIVIPQYRKEETKVAMNENKNDEAAMEDVVATLLIPEGDTYSMAKLNLCGRLFNSNLANTQSSKRAIIFVVDKSGSMSGGRITAVQTALLQFVEEVCEAQDPNVILHLILFRGQATHYPIPKDRNEATQLIKQQVTAGGGTDFYNASLELVKVSKNIIEKYPEHEITLIMCSDGEVGKDNAQKAHNCWKEFINAQYLKQHSTVPYVECIGISNEHDADILGGFICVDENGNYSKCVDGDAILESFMRSQKEAMSRVSIKIIVQSPFNILNNIYTKDKTKNKVFLLTNSDFFNENFFVDKSEVNKLINKKKGQQLQLCLLYNNESEFVPITIQKGSTRFNQILSLEYYNQYLNDIIQSLKNIKKEADLKQFAKTIDVELKNNTNVFAAICTEEDDKIKTENALKLLFQNENALRLHNEGGTNDAKIALIQKRRAELMKYYKNNNRNKWKKLRKYITSFESTLSSLKHLIKEILSDATRLQEIRQHIMELHFTKKHSKRVDKLILSDEELLNRDKFYENAMDKISNIKAEDYELVTAEYGTGCFLSTLTLQDIVEEGEPLWLCGRVDQKGGLAVSNPEAIKIEYISPDLCCDSYFRMALKSSDDKGFCDSSRQNICVRIFPIYANQCHYDITRVFLNEALSHCLSGRTDLKTTEYGSLFAVIGYMITRMKLTHLNIDRIFNYLLPSLQIFARNTKSFPFVNTYQKTIDFKAEQKDKITLKQQSLIRLSSYLSSFASRTSSWISNINVLFTDKLLNYNCTQSDMGVNLSLHNNAEFWLSALLAKLRGMLSAQYFCCGGERNSDNDKKIDQHQLLILYTILNGNFNDNIFVGAEESDDDDKKEEAEDVEFDITDSIEICGKKEYEQDWREKFDIPSQGKRIPSQGGDLIDPSKLAKQLNVTKIRKVSKEMCIQIISRITPQIEELLQAVHFFKKVKQVWGKDDGQGSEGDDDEIKLLNDEEINALKPENQIKSEEKSNETLQDKIPRLLSKDDLSYQSALVIIPPQDLWKAIQDIRMKHDKAFPRWMPHITVFFPFCKEAYFQQQIDYIRNAVANMRPFEMELNYFNCFKRAASDKEPNPSIVVYLEPSSTCESILQQLYNGLVGCYPVCFAKKNAQKYHAHLTVGQFGLETLENTIQEMNKNWKPVSFECNSVYLISKRENEKQYQIRHKIDFGQEAVLIKDDGLSAVCDAYFDDIGFCGAGASKWNMLRALIGVALLTSSSNAVYRQKLNLFGDDDTKYLVNNPDVVLQKLYEFVMEDIQRKYKTFSSEQGVMIKNRARQRMIDKAKVNKHTISDLEKKLQFKVKDAASKKHLTIIFCGHVDSGKSTTTARLLFQLGGMSERDVAKLRVEAKALGKESFLFAFFMDKSKEERARGVTIEATLREFYTDSYHYTVIDGPGHRDFTKNMIRAQAAADVAVLMVPADKGGFESSIARGNHKKGVRIGESRSHARLCHLVGIEQLIVCINKMDHPTVNWAEIRFYEIKNEIERMLIKIGYKAKKIAVIPISGFKGINLMNKKDLSNVAEAQWYKGFSVQIKKKTVDGFTLLDALENVVKEPKRYISKPFRMPVYEIHKIKGVGDVVVGRVEQGKLIPGCAVKFYPSQCSGTVFSIEAHHKSIDCAYGGDVVGVNVRKLDKNTMPKRGDVMCIDDLKIDPNPPLKSGNVQEITALIFVVNHPGKLKCATLGKQRNRKGGAKVAQYVGGYTPTGFVRTARSPLQMIKINWKVGASTNNMKVEDPQFIEAGDQAQVVFMPKKAIVVEPFDVCKGLARLACCDANTLVMLGKIIKVR